MRAEKLVILVSIIALLMLAITPVAAKKTEMRAHANEIEKVKLDNQPKRKFVGSKKRRSYHVASCENARRILPENVILFQSKKDAKNKDIVLA